MITYYPTLVVESVASFTYMIYYIGTIIFQISACSYVEAFVDDFKQIIQKMNNSSKMRTNDRRTENIELKQLIIDGINLHVDMLE